MWSHFLHGRLVRGEHGKHTSISRSHSRRDRPISEVITLCVDYFLCCNVIHCSTTLHRSFRIDALGLRLLQYPVMKCIIKSNLAAARLLTGTRKYDHITPVLRELHWLPITSRIQYKVTLLVYKTLHGPAPQYLQDLIQYRSARPGLRSAGILLNVPMTRSVTYGDRAFCSIGPTWWNSLPSELKTSPSVDSFKRNLKTHLFKLAYGQ